MNLSNFIISTLLATTVVSMSHGAAATSLLRGSDVGPKSRMLDDSTSSPTSEPTAYPTEDMVGSTQYTNLKLCTKAHSETDSVKYYWLSMVDKSHNNLGSCLVTLPANDETEQCCTLEGSIDYTTNNSIIVSDPHAVSSDNPYCGPSGGPACPDYDFSTNVQSLGYVEVKESNGTSLRKPDKFIHKQGDSKCGLGDRLGYANCNPGSLKVYGDFHVGTGDCLQSAISLSKYCDGHYGYVCKDSNC